MSIRCQGKRCTVRNQCANYEKNITAQDQRRTVPKCTNQKSFTKKEEEL